MLNLKSKLHLSLLLFLLLATGSVSFAQCTFNSTNGYSVEVVIVPKSIVPTTASCAVGSYNYNVEYDYSITFSGSNIPSNMWTLYSYLTCGSDSMYLELQTTPTSGTTKTTTANVTRNDTDCNSATPASLNCNSATVTIQGPNLSSTASSCPPATALPVEFLEFNANLEEGNVVFKWQTASELNNNFFTIESLMNDIWIAIDTVKGSGTTQQITEYEHTTKLAYKKKNQFRLKQTDFDGSHSYSPVITVYAGANLQRAIWPNPATNSIHINLIDIDPSSIIVTNSVGSDFTGFTGFTTLLANKTSSTLDISLLPVGIYTLQLENQVNKIVKQ